MKQLLLSTAAYAAVKNDVKRGCPSHAYMLHFADRSYLRTALKYFALAFFGFSEDSLNGKRIFSESFPDCVIYPEEGKKLSVDGVSALIADSSLKPVEGDKKLYILDGFSDSSAIIQNKLLKVLEEPPQGVHFLLGVTTLAPILDTVRSRVKTLTIPPFSAGDIYAALERLGENPLNREAAESCGGIFGTAENMVRGDWFATIAEGAREICSTQRVGDIFTVCAKYGDTKYKNELLSEMEYKYFSALREVTTGKIKGDIAKLWCAHTLTFALECVNKAYADVKFNANFQGLLYDLMLRVIEENDRWLKLQA